MPSTPPITNAVLRRNWPVTEKRRLVELTLEPNASVQSIAKKYHLDPPTLSSWRTLYRKGLLEIAPREIKTQNTSSEFLPVTIRSAPAIQNAPNVTVTMQISSEITLKIEVDTLDYSGLGALLAWVRQ